MSIPAYPLHWPEGWKRTDYIDRKAAQFRTGRQSYTDGKYQRAREVTIAAGTDRVLAEIRAFTRPGRRWVIDPSTVVISSNLLLRNDGLPRSGQREPDDPGVAVYWITADGDTRCMAIDRYLRVADNLAAIAATLDAMRAIERHGGAAILDRAFTGFTALPDHSRKAWHVVLGVPPHASTDDVQRAYKVLRSMHHPDKGGDADAFQAVQAAWETFRKERGLDEVAHG